MKKYRNKYQGQRAWIVGNGPSLDRTPLDRLVGEYAFGINRIGQHFDKTEWRPCFYICSTSYSSEPDYKADVIRAIECSQLTFINSKLMSILADEIPPGHSRKVHWLEYLYASSEYRHVDPDPDWWNPVTIEEGKIANFGTSAFACSQILAYMGFNPIYLIGCDLGYKAFIAGEPDPNHFGDDYESGAFQRPQDVHDLDNPRYILSHEIMVYGARKMGIRIFNATLGGELEVYERVDFFDVV